VTQWSGGIDHVVKSLGRLRRGGFVEKMMVSELRSQSVISRIPDLSYSWIYGLILRLDL